jgi:hypothetical protein
MSTNIFEVFSTWKWVIPCLRAKTIPMYMPHISTWSVSHESILRAKLLKQLLLLCRRRHPHPTHISWTFVTVITIEFNPSFLRLIPPNKNGIFFLWPPSIRMSLHASINLRCFPKNDMNWVVGTSKDLLKDTHVSPNPQVPTCYHENSVATLIVCPIYYRRSSPSKLKKKKLVIWLEAISLIHIWVAMMQSHGELSRLLAHKQDT